MTDPDDDYYYRLSPEDYEQMSNWEDYLYPGTSVLVNKFNLTDPIDLHFAEYTATADRQIEIANGTAQLASRDYGADHIKAIHGYLFQDVYDWAGEYRTVDMVKGDPDITVGFVSPGDLDYAMGLVQERVSEVDWAKLDRPGFVQETSWVFAMVNQAHPFREGNGRTSKVFMQQVAEQSPWRLDFSQIDPDYWNAASELSRPQPNRMALDERHLWVAFSDATSLAPVPPAPPVQPPAPQIPNTRSASYPGPAQNATQPPQNPQQGPQQGQPYRPPGYGTPQPYRGPGRS